MSQSGGRIEACSTCGHFACVCDVKAEHMADCKYRIARAGSVAIECEHGYDVCPVCDPCTCAEITASIADELGLSAAARRVGARLILDTLPHD